MSTNGKIIIGGLLGFLVFLLGIWVTIPKVVPKASSTPGQATMAVGKPPIARRSPSETPTSLPNLPQRTPQLTSTKGSGWIISEATRVHQGAGLNYPVATTLKYGRRVQLLEVEEGWQKIMFDGRQFGWVQTQFVSGDRPKDLPAEGPEEAIKTLTGFYQDINKKRLANAYDRLSFEFKRSLSYAQFEQGYANVEQSDVRVVRADLQASERFVLQVELLITEARGLKGFRGEYIAIYEQGQWKLEQGTLRAVDPDKIGPFSPNGDGTPGKPAFPDPTPEASESPDI